MAIWKKQSDGAWKMVADTFNSDLPSIAPAPPKTHETRHSATKHRPRRNIVRPDSSLPANLGKILSPYQHWCDSARPESTDATGDWHGVHAGRKLVGTLAVGVLYHGRDKSRRCGYALPRERDSF